MAIGPLAGKGTRVRIYTEEGQVFNHQPLPIALLLFLRKEGAAGASVFRGIEGFGGTGEMHTARLVDLNQPLPILIEWIDTPEMVERLLPKVAEMIRHGLITVDSTEVAYYSPYPVRDVTSDLCAADIMSRAVCWVTPDTPILKVVEALMEKPYRAVPVVKEGKPVGIITNLDLLMRAGLTVRLEFLACLKTPELHSEFERLAKGDKTAESVMTPNPVTVDQVIPLTQVAEVMADRHLKRLPVVDHRGTMVGMVSRIDLLRTAVRSLDSKPIQQGWIGFALDAPVSQSMRRDVPTVFLNTPLSEVVYVAVSTPLALCIVIDEDRRVKGRITGAEILERITPALRPGALRSLMHHFPFAHPKPEEARTEQHAAARVAADLMIDAAEVRDDAILRDAIAAMLTGHHKIVAVVDQDRRLVGCLDRADMLHGLLAGIGTRE